MSRWRMGWAVTGLVLLATLLFACGDEGVELVPGTPNGSHIVSLPLTSPAFANGEMIPAKYTRDGDDISPPLQWGRPPEGTKTFALVVDDPDASGGIWIHWLVFNLPGESRGLSEGLIPPNGLPPGAVHGQNSWGDTEYAGPNPPSGTHHYYIRVYALDAVLGLEPGVESGELVRAMEGHVLGYGELMGIYSH